MALPVIYTSGTASVTNGETTVTGSSTLWGDDAIMAGDLFCDPAQPLVPPQRVASVTDDGELELAVGWPGTTMTDDAYEIRFVGIIERSTAQTRRLLEQLSVVRANGQGRFFRFSDTTTDADPGAGYVRLNNADPSLATALYIDVLDANGASVAGEIDSWDDSSSLAKGKLWLSSITAPSTFHAYAVTGSVVDGTGYRNLTLTHIGGSGSFAADDELMVAFARTGDRGEGYITDTEVADPSELTALEGEDAGYRVFVLDLQTDFGAYSGRSGVVELIAGPDWQLVTIYTGPKGDTGDQGDKGWSPQIVVVEDGARRVHQLAGYVGGEGTAPTANVGEYLKGDGTFTATIGDAADVRGPAGANGEGTVASVEAGTGITVDDADPTAPVISLDFTVVAGDGIAVNNTDPAAPIISSTVDVDAAVQAALQAALGIVPAIARWNAEQSASRVFWAGTGLTSAESPVSGGASAAGRTAVSGAVGESVRQDGFIRTVKLSVNSVGSSPTDNIRIKVLRPNGATYDVVANSEYLTAGATGMNTWQLSTPLPVAPGDQIGVWMKGGGVGVCTLLNSAASSATYRYIEGDAVGGETWTDVPNISLLSEFQGIKPFAICFGESIIEGHNGAANWHAFGHAGFGSAGNPDAEPFNQVRDIIPTLDYQNYAIGGSLWSSVVTRASTAATYAPPRAAIVACGVNDVVAGTTWASVLASMNAWKAALPGVKLFVSEMLPYTPGNDAQAATIRLWNGYYADWCAANGATLIPCWEAMGQVRPSTGFKDDLITGYHYSGGHLTVPDGVDAYAALIAEGLQSVLWL